LALPDPRRPTTPPTSSDQTANSIEPPVADGKPAESSDEPTPTPADDDGEKVAVVDQRRRSLT
jgi:hypothetical protein